MTREVMGERTVYRYKPPSSDYVHLKGTVIGIDTSPRQLQIEWTFVPHGTYAGPEKTLTAPLAGTVKDSPISFNNGTWMPLHRTSLAIDTGRAYDYPRDRYTLHLPVVLYDAERSLVPLALSLRDGADGSFSLHATAMAYGPRASMQRHWADLTFSRPHIVVVIVVAQLLAVWVLTLGLLVLAVTYVWRPTQAGRSLVSMITLVWLLALPAMRQAFPGIPVTLCQVDTLGIQWPMVITSISAALVVWNWVWAPSPATGLHAVLPKGHPFLDIKPSSPPHLPSPSLSFSGHTLTSTQASNYQLENAYPSFPAQQRSAVSLAPQPLILLNGGDKPGYHRNSEGFIIPSTPTSSLVQSSQSTSHSVPS
ncbi:hypothetical protein H4R35_005895 [Dimargaris xerosporica]|nr:hypothetical protein H4R35_005895 [Dimargaris xerosporica]